MMLELADSYNSSARTTMLEQAEANSADAYVFVPGLNNGQGAYVREDLFDDLPDDQWLQFMSESVMDEPGMGILGLGKRAIARKKEKRATRLEAKQKRIETRSAVRKPGAFGKTLTQIGGMVGLLKPPPPEQLPYPEQALPPEPTGGDMTKKIIFGGLAFLLIGGVIIAVMSARRKRR